MIELRLHQLTPAQIAALRLVSAAASGPRAFLVGGAIRDVLLGRRGDDLDLAVPAGASDLARTVASSGGGTYVGLDPVRGTARAVIPAGAGAALQIDVADFRAGSLEGDLAGRDFTADAMAVPLPQLMAHGRAAIVDPLGGRGDLAARRLRLASPAAIASDPLRALRGVRLEVQLGFRLDRDAVSAVRAEAPRLAAIAAERILIELTALLGARRGGRGLRRADELGLLGTIVPEIEPMRGVIQPAPHRFDVLEHSLRAATAVDRLVRRLDGLAPFAAQLSDHLADSLGGGFTRAHVLRLAALLHDVSKPETRELVEGRLRFFNHDQLGAARARAIGERLRLPGSAVDVLERLVRHHLRVMHLEQVEQITRRARYRFFRELGADARDLLLLALADAAALTGESPLAVWNRSSLVPVLMAGWHEDQALGAAPPLLRGEDVMVTFGLTPGPEVGRLLARAREAQHLGLVTTREEALAFLDSSEAGP